MKGDTNDGKPEGKLCTDEEIKQVEAQLSPVH